MPNRLAGETSPYLLQHVDNPVEWYPWGDEAFARARAEDKPVFVSIGYAACHWCHVMAHESFEDPAIAKLMNELFVNIKVDREERPDVDAIYMNAIQVMGEGGGWPLSAFCMPDGKPYFLGTYFPPADKYGRPGFPKLLNAMSSVYHERREEVVQNTEALIDGLRQIDEHFRRQAEQAQGADVDEGLLVAAGRALAQRTDAVHGGLGGKPKFPASSTQDLLGRCGRLKFGKPAREAFLLQAKTMAAGGIYDHLGGGFARYAVDEKWLVPHFEKMLYDNAQLLGIYADAYALTADPDFLRVIDETVGWLEREMRNASGALYASQDADSEGEEGKFYVWTPAEIAAVLGPVDAMFFDRTYGVTAHGNFEHGTTVLSRLTPRGPASDEEALASMRQRLFEARRERIPPGTDTKILAGWNGLAVSGLLRAWEVTGHAGARRLADGVAAFLVERMLHDGGARLWRTAKDDGAGGIATKLDGTIDDYAFVALGFLDMAEATGDAAWWQRGAALLGAVRERFYSERDGLGIFYMTGGGEEESLLVHRPESHHDGAIPSGAAVAVEGLLRLARIGGDEVAGTLAERYVVARAAGAASNPFGGSRLLAVLDLYLHATELVITEGSGRDALLDAARRAYAPTMLLAGPWAEPSLLAGRSASPDGRAQAFVCRGQTCAAPVSDPAALADLLAHPPG